MPRCQVAGEIDVPDAMVVVILPDGGRSYLSKVYSDGWMRQYGFLERDPTCSSAMCSPKREAGQAPALVRSSRVSGPRRDRAAAPAPRLPASGRQPR